MADLQDQYKKFAVFSLMNDALIVLDKGKRIQYLNIAAERLFETSRDQIAGKLLLDVFAFQGLPARWPKKGWRGEVSLSRGKTTPLKLEISIDEYGDDSEKSVGKILTIRDMTDKKTDEPKKNSQLELLHQTLDISKDAIVMIGMDGTITLFNQSAKTMFGYGRDELNGKDVSLLIPQRYRQEHRKFVRGYLDTGVSRGVIGNTLELMGARKSGDVFPVELSLSAGEIDGERFVMAIIRDITERKDVERQIEERSRELQIINKIVTVSNQAKTVQELSQGILDIILDLLDFECGRIYLYDGKNKKAYLKAHRGYSPDFIKTRQVLALTNGIREQVFEGKQPLFMENYDELRPEVSQLTGMRSLASIPILSHDVCIGALTVSNSQRREFTDFQKMLLLTASQQIASSISRLQAEEALRLSEEQYRSLITNQGEGIATVDEHENFKFCNPMSEEIFGVARGKLMGRNLYEFIDEKYRRIIENQTSSRRSGRKSTYDLEIIRPSGERRQLIVTATAQYDENRNYIGSFGIFRDITERKIAEQALRESEYKYRSLLENMRYGFANFKVLFNGNNDPNDLIFLEFNQAAEELLALHREKLIHQKISDLFPTYRQELETYIHLFGNLAKKGGQVKFDRFLPQLNRWFSFLAYSFQKSYFAIIFEDITERKHAEQALRESETKYRGLFNNMRSGYAYCEVLYEEGDKPRDIVFRELNRAFEDITNFPRGMVLDRRVSDLMPQMHMEESATLEMLGNLAKAKGQVKFDYFSQELNKWFTIFAYSEGNRYFSVLFDDITERKEAENALRASEERYRQLVESSQDIIYRTDVGGRFTYMNPVGLKKFGYSKENIIGRHFSALVASEHRGTVKAFYRRQYEMQIANTFFELPVLNSIGEAVWIGQNVQMVWEGSEFQGFQAVARDITERRKAEEQLRESEEKYRNLVETASDGICIIQDMRLKYINPQLMDMLAFPYEEMIDRPFHQFVPRSDRPNLTQLYERHISGERNMGIFETCLIRKDGTCINTEINGSVISFQGAPATLVVIRDVTERKRVTEALQEREKQYRLIAENVTDVIWTMDLQLNYTYLSPSVQRVFGSTVEESMKRPLWRSTPADKVVPVIAVFQEELAREGQPGVDPNRSRTIEFEQMCADGSMKWTEITATFLRDDEGKATGLLGITRDISERKKTEEALRESEKTHRLLAEFSSDVIWKMNMNLQFTYISPAVLQLFKYPPSVALTHSFFEIMTEDSVNQFLSAIQDKLEKVPHGVLSDRIEAEMIRNDGSTFWAEVSYSVLRDEHGVPFEIQGSTRDISERKKVEVALRESERRYRMVTENSKDIIWTYDLFTQTFTFISSAMEWILGFTSAEATGKRLTDFLPQDSAFKVADEFRRMIDHWPDNPNVFIEGVHRHKNGSLIWMEINGTIIPNEDGSITTVTGVSRDITERKRAEEEQYRLITLIEKSHDFIGLASLDGQVLYLNEAGRDLVGLESLEEAKKTTIFDYAPEANRNRLRDLIIPVIYESGFWEGEGKLFHRQTNEILDLEIHTFLLRSELTGEPMNIATVMRDITGKKKAEMALRESEENFRTLAEHAIDGILIGLGNEHNVYANPRASQITGYTPEELIGKTIEDLVDPHDYPDLQRRFFLRLEGQPQQAPVVATIVRKDGSRFFADLRSARTLWQKQPAVMVYLRDITEQLEAEKALKFRLALLRLLTNIATSFINFEADEIEAGIHSALRMMSEFANVDRSFLFLFSNDGKHLGDTYEWFIDGESAFAQKLSGLKLGNYPWWFDRIRRFETISITDIDNLSLEMHPDERAFIERNRIKSILAVPLVYGNKLIGSLGFVNHRDKSEWSVEISALLTTVGVIFANAQEHKRKSEELKNSEETSRALLNATTDMALLMDDAGTIQALNEAAAELIQNRINDLIGENAFEMFAPYVNASRDRNVFQTNLPIRYEEDLQDRWIDKIVYPIADAHGEVSRVAVFAHDITNIKRSQNELREALHRAREAEMLKSRFLANMSHEIRTPLNHIIGLTSIILMQRNIAEDEVINYLKIVRRSGESLLTIINTVLDLAKIEAGRMEPAMDVFDFREFIEGIYERFKSQAITKSLECQLNIAPEVPNKLSGDAFMLERVLSNLLSNAVKFTHEGWIKLAIAIEEKNEAFNKLHFTVSDSGIGIADDQFDKIYQSFYQVDSSSTREYRGTGLGLTISRELVKLMRGDIWVESELNQGTVFHFTCEMTAVE